MSICINNDLIWVSVPKCASMSIEKTIMNHPNINYKHIIDVDPYYKKNKKWEHLHINIKELKYTFGDLETVCLKRDWFDRWKSCFEYIWQIIDLYNFTPRCKFENVDNEFIYKMFTDSFINKLYDKNFVELFELFINEKIDNEVNTISDFNRTLLSSLNISSFSQNLWTDNEKCNYEFNVNEMYKFEEFISNRYNIDFKVCHINKSEKPKTNIIENDELKKFIWDKFEKPFVKRYELI